MQKKYTITALFLLMMTVSFTASAATVEFESASGNLGGNVTVKLDGYNNGYPETSWGGMMMFNQTGGTYNGSIYPDPSGSESRFAAFCLDWTNWVSTGVGHNLSSLALGSNMGQSKADDISRLMYNVYPDFRSSVPTTWYANTQSKYALAIQIAIWEIVHEDPSTTYDVWSGDIEFTWDQYDYDTYDARQVAQYWLNEYVTGNSGPKLENLFALTKLGSQDLLVQTPIPGAVWLCGSSFAGLIGFGKRRKKQS